MQPLTLATMTKDDRVSNRPAYDELTASLEAEFRPQCLLEVFEVASILRARWRLDQFAAIDEASLPEPGQRSLAQIRTHAQNSVRRGTVELRRLQTERQLRAELGLGHLPPLLSIKDYLQIRKSQNLQNEANQVRPYPQNRPAGAKTQVDEPISTPPHKVEANLLTEIIRQESAQKAEIREMKIRTHSVPRNAPCPCKSGQKYKRCCGFRQLQHRNDVSEPRA